MGRDLRALSQHPARHAWDALRRSLPRTQEAVLVVQRLRELLADRAWEDPFSREGNVKLAQRDGDWLIPGYIAQLGLDVGLPSPPPPMDLSGLSETTRRRIEALQQPQPSNSGPTILAGGTHQRSARLTLSQGESSYTLRYDERGVFCEATISGAGDQCYRDPEDPFLVDPQARRGQLPPIAVALRPELDPHGLPIDRLAELLAEQDMSARQRMRARVPAPVPGGLAGVHHRGSYLLKERAFRGELEGAGWAVIDAFNGSALGLGATLEQAHAAWLVEVERLQPLPPEPPSPPDTEPLSPSSALSEGPEGELHIKAQMTIAFVPELIVDWPPPRPENTPCLAIPLPPLPEPPLRWVEAGYTRVVRHFGDEGHSAFSLVREEPDGGLTRVGCHLLDELDPEQLEAFWPEQDARNREDWQPAFGEDPWRAPRWPWKLIHAQLFDQQLGRWREQLRGAGYGWSAGFNERGWNQETALTATRFYPSDPCSETQAAQTSQPAGS